jgi:putative membrane protein
MPTFIEFPTADNRSLKESHVKKTVIKNGMLGLALSGLLATGAWAQSSASNADAQGSQSGGTMSNGSMSNASMSNKGSLQLSSTDRSFIMKAAEGGMAEVQLGQLATQNASSDDVKKFGQRMVDDHTKANDQLKQLAESKGVKVPADLNAKDKATKDRLSKLNGAAFDRAYMKDMVQDHTKDVAEFRKESTSAKDSDVKGFASQTLPTLEDHLKEAKSITPAAGSRQSSGMQMNSPKQ